MQMAGKNSLYKGTKRLKKAVIWKPAPKLDKQDTKYVSRKFELDSLMLSALQVGTILQEANPTSAQSHQTFNFLQTHKV